MPQPHIHIIGVTGIAEVRPGDDLAHLLMSACTQQGMPLETDDVLVVTQKIVSKAEGRLVRLAEVEPSPFAQQVALETGKDPRHVEVILRESRRIVRMDKGVILAETRHGFVCANAGVDASNVAGEGMVALLPLDPDSSARTIRDSLRRHAAVKVAVIISDTFGRSWRRGIVNVAIGVAGIEPLLDYNGRPDSHGYILKGTMLALADELASAAELATGKIDRIPAAIIRGYPFPKGEATIRNLIMEPERDMFR